MDSAASPSRRRFLRQSFAFSALASLGSFESLAQVLPGSGARGMADLLMIGDWGYLDDHKGQTAVADAMRAYAAKNQLRPEALLFLGDNWYGDLPGGVDSPRWKTQFEDLYPASAFPGKAYAILGNHDYQVMPKDVNKVEAELAYAASGRSRFTMPSRWYSFIFPEKQPLVTFIALDSNVPHPDGQAKAPNFTLTQAEHEQQLEWFEGELKKPRATPHLIVMGHHPVYSDGPHGDHPVLTRDWAPLFEKYKVPIYLAGHDHDLQHLEFEGHPTSHFLSGGGGADLYNLKIEQSARGPFAQKVYGFSHLAVTRETMIFRHIDPQGRVLHSFSKTADGKIVIGA
ncbi:metallophosphoesterase [Silvibacterium dinghuense]|uniref:Metallophosphoesterase n=1 Tax=Silvibacterium dinghuense TaxID=1560006 RepID=A0A4Q1SIS7_9BACT|nr:metallophosphoesterase [Silvibacterium dinghuense]RXS97313.1 metallophosphoesterase [Silvibacterium dinghuense]GGG97984.1 acid phosphatase [Silvibacterium dinghuense]